jgi:hypothetical protein
VSLVSENVERLGPFAVGGTVAWTFPVGFVLLIGLIACFIGLAAFGYLGTVFPCQEEGRLASCFLVAGATSGACLSLAAFDSAATRTLAGVTGAVVLGALSYYGVVAVFAPHC